MIATTTDNRKWQYGRPTGSTYISGTKIDSVEISTANLGFSTRPMWVQRKRHQMILTITANSNMAAQPHTLTYNDSRPNIHAFSVRQHIFLLRQTKVKMSWWHLPLEFRRYLSSIDISTSGFFVALLLLPVARLSLVVAIIRGHFLWTRGNRKTYGCRCKRPHYLFFCVTRGGFLTPKHNTCA